jgi:hypothetical protein
MDFPDESIQINSDTPIKHTEYISAVITSLKQARLYLIAPSCRIKKTVVKYLAIVVTKSGIIIDVEYVQAIRIQEALAKLQEIQAFLGILIFYWQVIQTIAGKCYHSQNSCKSYYQVTGDPITGKHVPN